MSEHTIQQRIRLALSRGSIRLWRNNVGSGWVGRTTRVTSGNRSAVAQSLQPGDLVIRAARPLHAGLCEGSADLIGYSTVTIGPEHLGQRLAVFLAVEVKDEKGRPTAEQTAFIAHVQGAGGLAGVARSVEEAKRIASER